jgi:hypothetical protein
MMTFDKNLTHPEYGRFQISAYVMICLFSALVFSMYGLELPLRRDNAQYIYSAQRLLQGEMPYQSIFDMKTPLTSFVTAFALLVTQNIFDEPIKGVRFFYVAISITTILLTYALAKRLFDNKFESLLAPLMMIGFHGYIYQTAIGAEPKLLLLLFFVAGLIFIVDKKWFALGIASALCAFTWQPSGILLIAALIYAFMQKPQYRFSAFAKLAIGFLIPSVIIFGYFLLNGAFKELIQGAFIVHIYLDRPNENELLNITKMIPFGFPFSFWLIAISLLAFFIYGLGMVTKSENASLADNPFLPFLVILSSFLIASLIDFQSYPDFFVFLPFCSLGIIIFYRASIDLIMGNRLVTSNIGLGVFKYLFFLVLICVPLLNVLFSNIFSNHAAIWKGGLIEQKRAYSHIVRAALSNYDVNSNIIVIGVPEIPALLGFRNATQHASLGSVQGYDEFISSNYSVGFSGWLDEMSEKKPDLVVVKMSDLAGYSDKNRALFIGWLNSNFSKFSSNEDIQSEKFRSDNIQTWIRINSKS